MPPIHQQEEHEKKPSHKIQDQEHFVYASFIQYPKTPKAKNLHKPTIFSSLFSLTVYKSCTFFNKKKKERNLHVVKLKKTKRKKKKNLPEDLMGSLLRL